MEGSGETHGSRELALWLGVSEQLGVVGKTINVLARVVWLCPSRAARAPDWLCDRNEEEEEGEIETEQRRRQDRLPRVEARAHQV